LVTQLVLGPLLNKSFNEKNVAEFWQYFLNIVYNFAVNLTGFRNVWQNTPCTVCHPAAACLPHWCCWI